jgi:hypothetical protein
VIEVPAHDRGLLAVPAGADAEQEAPAAEQVEGRDLLGEMSGLRSGTSVIPVPSLSRVVVPDARASATKGSTKCE